MSHSARREKTRLKRLSVYKAVQNNVDCDIQVLKQRNLQGALGHTASKFKFWKFLL